MLLTCCALSSLPSMFDCPQSNTTRAFITFDDEKLLEPVDGWVSIAKYKFQHEPLALLDSKCQLQTIFICSSVHLFI